ncbi:uncharacterized protein LOC143369964 [Andrena cerasifolii]|uniref:uncharacterized protein LOC143369964 n=1 Tax=Andrena cerasifolii TaxID=2819439 RepID=UPI004037865D
MISKMAKGKKSTEHTPNQEETNTIDRLLAENKRLKQELETLAATVMQLRATKEQHPLVEVSTKKGPANLQSDHVARGKQPAADPRIQAIRSKNQTSRDKEREYLSQQSRPSTSTSVTTTAARAIAAAKGDPQGPKTTDNFDEVKGTLNDANTSYYSFTPKDQKNYNYLLKGLPQSF